jgi:phospholipid/cholesterol/gamma-HCH transport system substrate-binding protein
MFIEMDRATARSRRDGFRIPVRNTLPDVNLDEFLAMLDRDTRDYLRLLVSDAAKGLDGRGDELRDLYRRFEPLHRDLARVNGKVAERRANLRRLITNLNVLNRELATKDTELAQLIDRSAVVFRAFAREGGNIEQTVQELPGALRQTTETLRRVETFANRLGPAAERLRGPLGQVDEANAALVPLAREGRPILRDRIRPFVRRSARSCATCGRPRGSSPPARPT